MNRQGGGNHKINTHWTKWILTSLLWKFWLCWPVILLHPNVSIAIVLVVGDEELLLGVDGAPGLRADHVRVNLKETWSFLENLLLTGTQNEKQTWKFIRTLKKFRSKAKFPKSIAQLNKVTLKALFWHPPLSQEYHWPFPPSHVCSVPKNMTIKHLSLFWYPPFNHHRYV